MPAIDADIAALEKKLNDAKPGAEQDRVARAIKDALGRPNRPAVSARHSGPKSFQRTKALQLEISFAGKPSAVRLYYRHVNQAERYESVDMEDRGGRFLAAIPAAYTATPFPIAYYFEVTTGANARVLYPGLGPDLIQQPYYVVRMEGVKSTA
ncbi:MAG: hypothetical protein HYZ37_15285 [Candidatus Solibacter usitatus]|nr:hypothetical protein [Candidatus Solibacter usitatus]